jgi:hypothetical protein
MQQAQHWQQQQQQPQDPTATAKQQQLATIEWLESLLQQSCGEPERSDPVYYQHLHSLQQFKHSLLAEQHDSRVQQAAAEFDASMRGDPFAAMMNPTISSNARLAQTLRMGSMQHSSGSSSSSSNPAAGLFGAVKVAVQEAFMAVAGGGGTLAGFGTAGSSRSAAAGAGVSFSGLGSSTAAAAAAAVGAADPGAAGAAAAGSNCSSSGAAAAAAAPPLKSREVPFLRSWSAWEPMWEWFTQVRMYHACIHYLFVD